MRHPTATSNLTLEIGAQTEPSSVRASAGWWAGSYDGAPDGFVRLSKPDELAAWYALCSESEPRRALERAVATLEELLRNGKRDEVDRLLARVKVSRLAPTVVVGLVGITKHAQPPLASRPEFMERAEAFLRRELGDLRADKLLRHRR